MRDDYFTNTPQDAADYEWHRGADEREDYRERYTPNPQDLAERIEEAWSHYTGPLPTKTTTCRHGNGADCELC